MRGERFAVPRIDQLPSSAIAERAEMQRQGIKSLLAIPFMIRRRLSGVFLLATVSREVAWSDEDTTILSLASDILHGALRRRQLALELEQSQRQLLQSQKMEAVGTLAGGIAHDFNNQLAVMLGNVRYVLERQTESADTRDALQDLERAAEHCAQLTRSLLAFSRQGVQEQRTLRVVDWIEEVGELVKPLLPSSIDLEIRVDPEAGAVHGDETQLQQVVVNLLVNARDAMPDGGRVRVRAARRMVTDAVAERLSLSGRDMVEISVQDDGEGMAPSVRERIFEPFFTTKAMGQGTGLGLATVYGIVQQCGGGVEVESTLGEGATFRVYLPAHAPSAETPSAPDESDLPGSRSFETVLLVEDEPAVRRVVKRMLEYRAKHVIEARDGREALELVGDRLAEIDLLVTDMVMPRMGGLVLAREIAQRRSDLPTLFLSGYPDDELDFEREPLQHHRFLQKPFTERDLAAALEALLDTRR
jgi:two-component system cell cycle sensor histidine kinase/response regulator CckA